MMELITLEPQFRQLFNLLSAHRVMLGDELRVAAFAKAISETVKEGDVVVDLGTGTGMLAFLAVQAGARKVYAIERSQIINIAREVACVNGMRDKIEFHQGEAKSLRLPEKVDVVVSETIGHMGIAEDFLDNIAYARGEFLKPGGSLVPKGIAMYAAPVQCREAYDNLAFWKRTIHGIDFSPVALHSAARVYIHRFMPQHLLAAPKLVREFAFYSINQSRDIHARLTFNITSPGHLHGFSGWFKVVLNDQTYIDTSPFASPTHWDQCYFPVIDLEEVQPGFQVNLDLTLRHTNAWSWQAAVADVTIPPGQLSGEL